MELGKVNWAGVWPPCWCEEWLCLVSLWLVFCSNLLGSLCEPVEGASVPSAMWETNASHEKKKDVLLNVILIYLYIFSCLFVLLCKGLKFKVHTLYVGTCQPALLLNVMKSFCWSEPCVPNCMYIPLSMLWIVIVHKNLKKMKTILFSDAFPLTLKKNENTRVVGVSDLYPICAWVRKGFLLQFTKGWIQFVVFDWLQSCSSVGLKCLLFSLDIADLWGASSILISFLLCVTSSCIMSVATGWFITCVFTTTVWVSQ